MLGLFVYLVMQTALIVLLVHSIKAGRRSATALLESEKRFQALFESVPFVAVQGYGLDGKTSYWNKASEALYGYRAHEAIGRDLRDLIIPEELREGLGQAMREMATTGRPIPASELSLVRKDGSRVPVFSHHVVVQLQDRPPELFCLDFDLTGHKQAEAALQKSENRFRLLFENAPLPYDSLSENGTILDVNKKWLSTLGYAEKEEVVGQWIGNFIARNCIDDFMLKFSQLKHDGEIDGLEPQMVRKDGTHISVSLRIRVQYDENGEFLRTHCMFSDITERKLYEVKLLEAKLAAEMASKAKSEFLANMSHEIRTPISAILGFTGLALNRELPPKIREYLICVNEAGDSLLAIIDDILDISKIEAERLELETENFTIRTLLKQALRPLVMKATLKGLSLNLTVDPDLPEVVCGDGGRVRQVVNNFVSNAIKFTHRGGITLRARSAPSALTTGEEGVWLLIEVEDTGIGIPKDQQGEIFETFRQADSTTSREFGGTGLGLAISRHLVRMMGGSIWVESEEGRGSIFRATLRLEAERPAPSEPLESCPPAEGYEEARALRVLLVENDRLNQLIAQNCMEEAGHVVKLAANGKEALDVLAEEHFDVVVMDVAMPEMNGLEATRRIRAGEAAGARRIPILALTAHAIKGDRERFLDAGMDAYLSKPFSDADLKEALENLARRDA